ncbi:hypothetical protein ACERZ8_15070 [Tateyamaria armeniaca]|uniref:Uncharacterized protein n=1 Tax=Tateyamaria armeniaca TaxID=2518930 RepID=A0ABW8V178_9RHOB
MMRHCIGQVRSDHNDQNLRKFPPKWLAKNLHGNSELGKQIELCHKPMASGDEMKKTARVTSWAAGKQAYGTAQ